VNASEIRRKILEMLFSRFKEHPYHRITPAEFKESLGINTNELNYNMIYLEGKGFVELQKPLEGNVFVGARITSQGIDLVEDEYRFNITFPFDRKSDETPLSIATKLHALIDGVNASRVVKAEDKKTITDSLKSIVLELAKDEPSYTTVKKNLRTVLEKDKTTGSHLKQLLKNPHVARILSEAASRELFL
jgi:hypothetical protein